MLIETINQRAKVRWSERRALTQLACNTTLTRPLALSWCTQLPDIHAAFNRAKGAFLDAERLQAAEARHSSGGGGEWTPWGACSFPGAGDTFPASVDTDKAELCVGCVVVMLLGRRG